MGSLEIAPDVNFQLIDVSLLIFYHKTMTSPDSNDVVDGHPGKLLTPEQAHALYHILTHEETYLEIRKLRIPGTLSHSGSPFVAPSVGQGILETLAAGDKQDGTLPTPSPIIHRLFEDFVTTLPGLKDVSPKFWSERAQPLVEALSAANLSESYDKGSLALRKVLAIFISSMVEWAARGRFGKLQKQNTRKEDGKYDLESPDDVVMAWDDVVQSLVYGELVTSSGKK